MAYKIKNYKHDAHPIGTGLGAIVGGVSSLAWSLMVATSGVVIGPLGLAIGAGAGALIGGLAGKWIADEVNPRVNVLYWNNNYMNKKYVENHDNYYRDIYRTGIL